MFSSPTTRLKNFLNAKKTSKHTTFRWIHLLFQISSEDSSEKVMQLKISLSTFITFCKRPLYTQNMLKMSEYQRLVLQTKYMKNACRSTLKKPVFITNIYAEHCHTVLLWWHHSCNRQICHIFSSYWKKIKDKKETTLMFWYYLQRYE